MGDENRMIRNSRLKCTKCGFTALEFEWDEVYSHKHGGIVDTCCPACRSVGQSQYMETEGFQGRCLSGIERIVYTYKPVSFFIPPPNKPNELQYEEFDITEDNGWRVCDNTDGSRWNFESLQSRVNFIGIIYMLNGKETLHTSVDVSFGTPLRVRFRK